MHTFFSTYFFPLSPSPCSLMFLPLPSFPVRTTRWCSGTPAKPVGHFSDYTSTMEEEPLAMPVVRERVRERGREEWKEVGKEGERIGKGYRYSLEHPFLPQSRQLMAGMSMDCTSLQMVSIWCHSALMTG